MNNSDKLGLICDMLQSHMKRVGRVIENDEYNDRWENLSNSVNTASDTLGIVIDNPGVGGMLDIALIFYSLGCAATETDYPKREDIMKFIKGSMENDKRKRPLELKNLQLSLLKEQSLELASKLWSTDEKQEIKLMDMCEKVYRKLNTLNPEIFKYVPNDAAGLKPWLRKVAPDYAKKPGRPKRKNISVVR